MFRGIMGRSHPTIPKETCGAFENFEKGLKNVIEKAQEAWKKTPMGSTQRPGDASVICTTEESLEKEKFLNWNKEIKNIIKEQNRK